jgi:HAD superfamily hydrolase (TIGR01484 family)
MVKAIFFDIDGTLVSFETHKIPASTQEALKALRDKGIKIFIATGRPQCLINNLSDLEFDGISQSTAAIVLLPATSPFIKVASRKKTLNG